MDFIVNNYLNQSSSSHFWTLEKVIDESRQTGELDFSGRNLSEYPEYAKQCELVDTVIAGKCSGLRLISGLHRLCDRLGPADFHKFLWHENFHISYEYFHYFCVTEFSVIW